MSTNKSASTVRRLEFSTIVGQLFLTIGLLGLATLIQGDTPLSSVAAAIMKLIVILAAFGTSMFYSISAIKMRSNQLNE